MHTGFVRVSAIDLEPVLTLSAKKNISFINFPFYSAVL